MDFGQISRTGLSASGRFGDQPCMAGTHDTMGHIKPQAVGAEFPHEATSVIIIYYYKTVALINFCNFLILIYAQT